MSIVRNFSQLADNINSSGILEQSGGGTNTITPSLVAGSNITVSGTWPNQTIDSTVTTGPVGATGIGTTGLTGATGTAGTNGATGVAGTNGATGIGATGLTGATGTNGATGLNGATGVGATIGKTIAMAMIFGG